MTTKARTTSAPVLGLRALNRATLARQLLLRRASLSAEAAVAHLVGLQAQNVKPPYYALAARLDGFTPDDLSAPMADRRVARLVTLRSTLHTHTADDCLTLRPLVQAARDRELGAFRKGLVGVDLDRLAVLARELVEAEPRTMGQLREALLAEWPDADPQALSVAARCRLPLVQVTPRGLWGRSGQVTLTTAEHWLGSPATPPGPGRHGAALPRRLRARLRQGHADLGGPDPPQGRLRTAPSASRHLPGPGRHRAVRPARRAPARPETPAPPRFLPEFDNLLLSHADRTRLVPPAYKGRTWAKNTAYRVLLVDGFVAGLWRLDDDALVVEPFGPLTGARRDEVVAEGERMLAALHPGSTYAVRFGTVRG
ncbi:AlkZ family DNA glycosylase [Streptomyces parvulus]|nr:AlkZ family DNA glycosylase [Streptomyces parvulus]